MSLPARRKCRHCLRPFVPDYRNAYHQRFCPQMECKQASKRCSQRRWLRQPKNRNYFREPDNIARVREWRLAHPDYWRHYRSCRTASAPVAPPLDPTVSMAAPSALQDFCRSKAPVFIALVSRLGRCALQEDIANCARQVVLEAQCILLHCQSNQRSSPPAPGLVNYHETG